MVFRVVTSSPHVVSAPLRRITLPKPQSRPRVKQSRRLPNLEDPPLTSVTALPAYLDGSLTPIANLRAVGEPLPLYRGEGSSLVRTRDGLIGNNLSQVRVWRLERGRPCR